MKFIFKKILFLILLICFFSCGSRKEIVYLQDIDAKSSYESAKSYDPKLQADDLLSIVVSAESPEVTVPFNIPDIEGNDAKNRGFKTYLIDNTGYIDFPIIGKIKLGGLTRAEASTKLIAAISEYIKAPTVTIRIVNYKVSVLGEVNNPGSFNIPGERITILEALSLAGDLSIYGKRDNILVIREIEGKKTYTRLNLTQADIFESPFYYLSQNDVVFIEPNKTKINASKIGADTTLTISAISLLITITVLLVRN